MKNSIAAMAFAMLLASRPSMAQDDVSAIPLAGEAFRTLSVEQAAARLLGPFRQYFYRDADRASALRRYHCLNKRIFFSRTQWRRNRGFVL
jgi:hypothetical protein